MNQDNNARYTIALLMDSLFDPCEEKIWSGALYTASKLGLNLVCFLGGAFREPGDYGLDCKQAAYELLNKEQYDGVIALMGSLGNYLKESEYIPFLQRFSPLPFVSVNRPMENAINILIDNETGMRRLMEHMIEEHHYKRIAYIRGSEFSKEAEIRYRVYREALAAHNLPFDPALVVNGTFAREWGTYAIRILLDERKAVFDALIGANDCMAVYALKELQRRNIRIPEEVAVAGFDDALDALDANPQLTTVSQPLFELGCKAIKTMFSKLNGKIQEDVCLPTQLIVRGSCGCTSYAKIKKNTFSLMHNPAYPESLKPLSEAAIARALADYFSELEERLSNPNWASELVNAFMKRIKGDETGSYFNLFEEYVRLGFERDVGSFLWHKVINIFFHLVWPALKNKKEIKNARRFKEELYMLLGKISDNIQTTIRAHLKEQYVIVYLVYHDLSTAFDENLTRQRIKEDLPRLKINNFYLSLYEDSLQRDSAKLFMFYSRNPGDSVIIDDLEMSFSADKLIPGSFRKDGTPFAYIVLPLHFKKEQLGFILCEIGPVDGNIYETLITLLSATIKGSKLVTEVQQHAEELEKKVQERTAQLEKTQQQLLETAHQAGMAEVSVGVLHNVGNLLNSVGVSVQEIIQVLKKGKIKGLLKANEMLQSHADDLSGFFTNDPKAQLLAEYFWKAGQSLKEDLLKIQEESMQLHGRTELMQEIIQTIQEYAYGNRNTAFKEKADIKELIEMALKVQESNIRKFNIKIKRNFISLPLVLIQKNKLTHVLINLIKNATEAMEKNLTAERILSIKLMNDQKANIIIEISDTGVGVSEENIKKIFTYGFTTKKHGHGFGLHACANYMSEMGGAISVSSKGPGQGTVFTLVFRDLMTKAV